MQLQFLCITAGSIRLIYFSAVVDLTPLWAPVFVFLWARLLFARMVQQVYDHWTVKRPLVKGWQRCTTCAQTFLPAMVATSCSSFLFLLSCALRLLLPHPLNKAEEAAEKRQNGCVGARLQRLRWECRMGEQREGIRGGTVCRRISAGRHCSISD